MDPQNVLLSENGDIFEIDKDGIRRIGRTEAGVIYVDGLGVGDIKDVVLRDREHLSTDGMVVVVVAVNRLNGTIVQGPDIISRGVTYNADELHGEARKRVIRKLEKVAQEEEITDWAVLKHDVKNTLSQYIYEKTRRRPIVLPVILEV